MAWPASATSRAMPWVGGDAGADHTECGGDPVLVQQPAHPLCVDGAGAVVDGERYRHRAVVNVMNGPACAPRAGSACLASFRVDAMVRAWRGSPRSAARPRGQACSWRTPARRPRAWLPHPPRSGRCSAWRGVPDGASEAWQAAHSAISIAPPAAEARGGKWLAASASASCRRPHSPRSVALHSLPPHSIPNVN